MVSPLPTAGGVAGYFRNGTRRTATKPIGGDERGGLPGRQPAQPADGAGGDQGDEAAEGDADGEGAGEQAPGALVGAGDPVPPSSSAVRWPSVACLASGSVRGGGAGLLERDGGLDVGLTDLVGDEEGGEAGEEADEQPPDQEGACGHQGIRSR